MVDDPRAALALTHDLTVVSHNLCPYVQRAAIALMEKDVAFDRRSLDLSHKPAWFTALSPLGKVPLLIVRPADGEDAVLFESNVICEWIEETQPGPALHPADPLTRARHRAWMEFGSAILGDIWGLETTSDPDVFEAKRQAVADKFRRVEDQFGDGPWFGGQAFGLVDAVFGPVFRYFDVFDAIADLQVFHEAPKLMAWRARLSDRPSVKAAVDDGYNDRLGAFLRRHQACLLNLQRA